MSGAPLNKAPFDTIELRGIRVFGRHGANPGEQDVPQPFEIVLRLEVEIAAARASDALADTVDYAALHAAVVRIVAHERFALLERLGDVILDAALADPRVVRASVSIAKPALLGGATPVVTLHKERP